jgi:hypothetical protein
MKIPQPCRHCGAMTTNGTYCSDGCYLTVLGQKRRPVLEPRLSLSEIEARLTPEAWHKANVAAEIAEDASSDYASKQDVSTVGHRAWLDVILAALGKE